MTVHYFTARTTAGVLITSGTDLDAVDQAARERSRRTGEHVRITDADGSLAAAFRYDPTRQETPAMTLTPAVLADMRDLIAGYDADTLADPLVVFEQVVDHLRTVVDGTWPGDPQVTPAADDPRTGETGLAYVTFRWSTEHGKCFECPAPAAWRVWVYGDDREPARACAVCACNAAAEGGARIEHVDPEFFTH